MSDDSTQDRLEAAMSKEPDRLLAVADTPAGILIVGNPSQANYQLYRGMLMSDDMAQKAQAPDSLLKACAVDPDTAGMTALLKKYPGLAGNPQMAAAISQVVGITKGAISKK
jgi:hypothetical protein